MFPTVDTNVYHSLHHITHHVMHFMAPWTAQLPGVCRPISKWFKIMKKRRRPKCLTDLKTDVVAEKVFLGGVVEVRTPGVAQRVAPVEERVAARVKEQGDKDSLGV
ncbi:hypothetical protein ES703_36451 [subsurface metagenome]